jgi:hypothetical protein
VEREQVTELSKAIKRLELIKNLIILGENDEIGSHIHKLKQLLLTEEINHIVTLLQDCFYDDAIISIDNFLNKHRQLSIYINPKVAGLKLKAKALAKALNDLTDEKAELEKLIHDFNVRHSKELGALIVEILKHRKEKLKGTAQEEEAKKDYENYHEEYETIKEEILIPLGKKEEKELKNTYRKASKLCHPDVVSEKQKELAQKMFSELNEAYERNDLKRVNEILETLQRGEFFVHQSDATNEVQLLKAEIEKLNLLIKEINQQIKTIEESGVYKTIRGIEDWNKYFTETKFSLETQLIDLRDGKE